MALEAIKQYAAQETAKIEAVADRMIKNEAVRADISRLNSNGHTETPTENKQALKVIEDKITGIYKKQAQAIQKSEKLRSEINKMVLSGENPNDILIKSIECISLITGDTAFYKQNIEQLKQV